MMIGEGSKPPKQCFYEILTREEQVDYMAKMKFHTPPYYLTQKLKEGGSVNVTNGNGRVLDES